MTQITFLHGAHDRLQAACSWLAKTNSDGIAVVVFTPDAGLADQLDRLLWTHPANGFLPHCRFDSPLAGETPIVISNRTSDPPHDACLLNLSDEIPPNFSRFQRLVEIISIEDHVKLPGRERFRFYRERGYPLDNRDISGRG